jgi:hypothetical protein
MLTEGRAPGERRCVYAVLSVRRAAQAEAFNGLAHPREGTGRSRPERSATFTAGGGLRRDPPRPKLLIEAFANPTLRAARLWLCARFASHRNFVGFGRCRLFTE